MTKYLPKTAGLLLAAGAATMVLAGCGSGGGVGSSNTVRIRSIDGVPNGGNCQIRINNGTVEGQQTYDTASDYRYLSPGQSAFTFTFDDNNLTYPTTNQNLSGGTSNTVFLFGRADITDPSAVAYPSISIVVDDQSAPPSNEANLRFVAAAPDANPVNVLINGTTFASDVPYKTIENYVATSGGNVTVSVVDATDSAVLVPPTTINLAAGHADTLMFSESAVTPAITYNATAFLDF